MPYTAHGHFHGRYTHDAWNIPVTSERCGGLKACEECKAEAKAAREAAWSAPDALPSPLADLSDCRHGCNGDCLTSGSDVCNFTCHQ